MKYVGDATPAWSFPKKPKTRLEDYRSETTNCDVPDLTEGVKKFRSTQVSWTIPKSTQHRSTAGQNGKTNGVPPVGTYNLSRDLGKITRSSTANSENFQGTSNRNSTYGADITPGVGRYNIARRVFSSSLGFSFGSKVDDGWRNPQTPGPADYTSMAHTISHRSARSSAVQHRKSANTTAIKFGQQEPQKPMSSTQTGSDFRRRTQTPDANQTKPKPLYLLPDSLEVLRKTSSKIGTFARSKSVADTSSDKRQNPGPGFYNPLTDYIRLGVQKGRGYTLASKSVPPKAEEEVVPGPGMYPLPTTISNTAWSISKAKRMLGVILGESSRNPGPGTYNPKPLLLARSVSLTQDPRDKDSKKAFIPGPGTYDLRMLPGTETPNYTIRGRTKFNSPFPAEVEKASMLSQEGQLVTRDYSPDYKAILPAERSITFPRAQRPDLGRGTSSGPGIGAYNVPRDGVEYSTGTTFGTAKRKQENNVDEVFPLPGPGSYTIKSTIPQLQIYEQQKMDILEDKAGLFGRSDTGKTKEFTRVKHQLESAAGSAKISTGPRILRPARRS